MLSNRNITKSQLLKMIDQLKKNPTDRVRILGDVGMGAVGVGLGVAAAGTAAGLAGVTSIPVLTSAASLVGISVVGATPVGWTIGIAAAAGAIAYGVSRLIRDGGLSEGRKRELLQVYRDRLSEMQFKERTASITVGDRNDFITALRELVEKEGIEPKKAFQLIEHVERGTMPISQAYSHVSELLRT